jgi:23S rRNA (guanine2445-N2)-methyltransferase / 23S rRNA (guanine2069-N7)-methyltransferase
MADSPTNSALEPKDFEQAELFKARLKKRARHLRRWPTKRDIHCYRIYERDIPEIPMVVDRYGTHLHITEYERPHDRNPWRHAAWLELMRSAAAEALETDLENAHLKVRQKVRHGSQYEKVDSQANVIEVTEGGLSFLVNLTDYVDTGLFLDHRNTRAMVRKEALGKRFLNLFAYTGSFTVFAVAGGASSSMTVDLSRNYVSWANDNLENNGLAGPEHEFLAEDTIDYLRHAKLHGRRFDLCVVDPPTFSNSKRTEEDWDVQTRHVEMLNLIAEVMAPNGVVWFSTNFRRFKFEEQDLIGYTEIREVTKQTLPEEYRNRRIHRCWRMVVGAST